MSRLVTTIVLSTNIDEETKKEWEEAKDSEDYKSQVEDLKETFRDDLGVGKEVDIQVKIELGE